MMLEPKHKRFILSFIVLAVVAGTATFVYNKKFRTQQDAPAVTEDPGKLPDFAMGKVIKVEGENVYIKGAFQNDTEKELVGHVTSTTEVIKQMEIRGQLSTAKVNLSDIKEGQTVVVYYSNKSENRFDLDKIQILK